MIPLILILLSGIFKAAADKIAFHGGIFQSWGPYWNMETGWRLKWKNGDKAQGERFPGSSTIFVWTTDSFHLLQMLYLTCFFLAIVTYEPNFGLLWDFLLLRVVFGVVFEICFAYLFEKK
jgi:hypothetical protein